MRLGSVGFRVTCWGCVPRLKGGSSDIKGLYTARYSVPQVGTKVYVQVNQVIDGWESLPRTYWTIVPSGS